MTKTIFYILFFAYFGLSDALGMEAIPSAPQETPQYLYFYDHENQQFTLLGSNNQDNNIEIPTTLTSNTKALNLNYPKKYVNFQVSIKLNPHTTIWSLPAYPSPTNLTDYVNQNITSGQTQTTLNEFLQKYARQYNALLPCDQKEVSKILTLKVHYYLINNQKQLLASADSEIKPIIKKSLSTFLITKYFIEFLIGINGLNVLFGNNHRLESLLTIPLLFFVRTYPAEKIDFLV